MSYQFRGHVLPENLQESIDAFVELGRPTGGFLQAVLDNDLRQAFAKADERSIEALPAVIGYLYNECPAECWGFNGASAEWIQQKREARSCEKIGAGE